MSYRITVDRDVCISSGKCVADAPDVFDFDDDDLAVLVPGAVQPADAVQLDLARACPSGALRVHDTGSGEQIDVG
ncbi:ferredoxin [Pseudonocardia abyssalis]|uniref:Ferredoxin n=1 Tax=Pseudonocardia abyssalis TaxID=2792008 RepID=A0ABS6UR40_9PSEU|nr:(4Fe-4S)-binding protein [Pseudonocardia abyssalis]MBW0115060.1 (4Fe-4S)-binding protein [Pseudonocardia abyssalis]MBW0134709.1 (4Fe-4S)-binding protein [Pseudonocardia abyssalis]